MVVNTKSLSENQQTTRKTAHAVLWNYLSFGLGKGMVFVSTAILARLLTTEEFGLVGFATLTVSYLAVLKDLGLGAALIQKRDHVEESANTVFTMNLLLGIGLTLVTFAIAPFVANYFREPEVTPLLRVLGLTFVINALGSIHTIRLQRELAFNRKLVPDLGRSLAKGAASIGLALLGFGVWSLIWGQIVGAVTAVILAWIVYRWRPKLTIHRKLGRGLLGFGSTLLFVNILSTVVNNADYLVVGRVLGAESLGIYTLAYRLPELLVLNLLWVVSGAIFPAYAKIQDQPDTLRRGFLTTLRYIEMVSVPLCLGLLIAADPLVRVAFGEQWLEAVPVVRILALFVLVNSIGFNVGDIYKATGRPDILVKLGLVYVGPLLLALWFGSRYGLIGIALAHLSVGFFRTWIRLTVASRLIRVSWFDILKQLQPAFLSGFVLILLAVPITYLTVDLNPLLRLILIALAGAIGYLSVLWFLERDQLQEAIQLILKR
jgi:O-antigen/teichoic acid export membrane protein